MAFRIARSLVKTKYSLRTASSLPTLSYASYASVRRNEGPRWNQWMWVARTNLARYSHLMAWGEEGSEGARELKALLKLHWFDGKELGFPDQDTSAAKRHFREISQSNEYANKLHPNVFLVIDGWSVASYGHVMAVDASFDPDIPNDRAEESPGFDGQMCIMGNLIWSELYPMLMLHCTSLED
ncbi:hypothetical protein P175DRAFT_0532881 [Aspergillus ochraceoroseus IBT 24754]|uniref:Uncharacterized protein n=1 Tax=Aspergillus ochraceoroseus IBT 24754 TaxID=1392256 RepID=A0A2T5LUG4_9EURO|nr:uncharacterized protein P175DRAFT_0532881 [Aspergillus ochraceoroseus IBT 24754]PTU19924.1 hypothetical protein P175DRAFT_0532881 [Aspergillus ochraceoroseus IBT 24754]